MSMSKKFGLNPIGVKTAVSTNIQTALPKQAIDSVLSHVARRTGFNVAKAYLDRSQGPWLAPVACCSTF
jgi:hypothetical protein